MKRILVVVLLVAAGVLAIALVAYLVAARGLPEEARAELDGYLAYRYLSTSTPHVLGASQATRPSLFTAEMSSGSYSDTVHYQVMHNLRVMAAKQPRSPSSAEASNDASRTFVSNRPLPYPPQELWCVQLGPAEPAADVVLLALHIDLYNADWVVHELPPAWSADERRGVLANLGCASG